jgi:malonyl-CoA/methylmalonyl-CoA synthetase
MAVPLAASHPPPELAYVLDDAEPAVVVAHPELEARVRPAAESRGIRFLPAPNLSASGADAPPAALDREAALPDVALDRPALMIYTSGTTGRAKGVVTTHANVDAQIESLVDAWAWTRDDRILLVLPLHHVHGIVNVLGCALWSGALCDIHPRFDALEVWQRFAAGGLTLFMAVPTIYARLIASWDAASSAEREAWSAGARQLRLMVSGSAALPVSVLERWEDITGHRLLERYGMTEIGMGLGNPLAGPRRPGHVGVPFPGVEMRLVDEDGAAVEPGRPGEIEIRGPSVFREYWRRPNETVAAFRDGWFRTGDVAVLDHGSYRILGRRSVDIIKTGAEKVSALEVEETLRQHPGVLDCAVVGVPDPDWGERVCAAVVPRTRGLDGEALKEWARDRLAPYKLPRSVLAVSALPRNAMGKVTKPAVRRLFEPEGSTARSETAPPSTHTTP